MKLPAPTHPTLSRTVVALTMAGGLLVGSLSAAAPLFAQVAPGSTAASAQSEEITLTAIPPRLGDDKSLMADPGETLQTSVRVRNASNETIQVNSSVRDFIVQSDGETPIALENEEVSSRWSLADWIILTPSVSELGPNETATVNVIINVPEDALPGGHYAMITHQPGGNSANGELTGDDTGAASALNQRVGTLLYVVVDGPINEEAFIRGLNFPSFMEYGPVPFEFTVDNQSDIHITPVIGIEIYNFLGQKVDTINVESKNIFPLMSREFEGKWERIWGIGPYTAKVVMSYGSQGQVVIATTTFWLFPVFIALAAVVVLMTLLVVSIAFRRHMAHRNDENRKKVEMLEQRLAEMESQRITDQESTNR